VEGLWDRSCAYADRVDRLVGHSMRKVGFHAFDFHLIHRDPTRDAKPCHSPVLLVLRLSIVGHVNEPGWCFHLGTFATHNDLW
jgi:hypothetical protein